MECELRYWAAESCVCVCHADAKDQKVQGFMGQRIRGPKMDGTCGQHSA